MNKFEYLEEYRRRSFKLVRLRPHSKKPYEDGLAEQG